MKEDEVFLHDEYYLSKEVKAAGINKHDKVLEIGGGTGNLTKFLLNETNNLIVIEINTKLYHELLNKFKGTGIEVIHGNILKMDLKKYRVNKVVSNIPYSISSPILYKLLDMDIELAILAVQKEFGERLCALPGSGNYSRLTVTSFLKADISQLFDIPRSAFNPQPEVDSVVVKVVPLKKPRYHMKSKEFTDNFILNTFSHRRKKIGTILKKYYGVKETKKYKEVMDLRIEELEVKKIVDLSNFVYSNYVQKNQ